MYTLNDMKIAFFKETKLDKLLCFSLIMPSNIITINRPDNMMFKRAI